MAKPSKKIAARLESRREQYDKSKVNGKPGYKRPGSRQKR